jgi:hypothetical protein
MFTCFQNILKSRQYGFIFIKECKTECKTECKKESIKTIVPITTDKLQEETYDNDWGFYVVLDSDNDYLKNTHFSIINYSHNKKYRNTLPTIREDDKTDKTDIANKIDNILIFKKNPSLCTVIITVMLTFIILNI